MYTYTNVEYYQIYNTIYTTYTIVKLDFFPTKSQTNNISKLKKTQSSSFMSLLSTVIKHTK